MDNVVMMPDRLAAGAARGNPAADKMAAGAAKVSGGTPGSLFADLQERIGMGRAVAVDGQAFGEIREALGFSQRDLERVSGVSRSTISEYETEGAVAPEMERTLLLGLRRMAYERHRDTLLALAVMEKAVNG